MTKLWLLYSTSCPVTLRLLCWSSFLPQLHLLLISLVNSTTKSREESGHSECQTLGIPGAFQKKKKKASNHSCSEFQFCNCEAASLSPFKGAHEVLPRLTHIHVNMGNIGWAYAVFMLICNNWFLRDIKLVAGACWPKNYLCCGIIPGSVLQRCQSTCVAL